MYKYSFLLDFLLNLLLWLRRHRASCFYLISGWRCQKLPSAHAVMPTVLKLKLWLILS